MRLRFWLALILVLLVVFSLKNQQVQARPELIVDKSALSISIKAQGCFLEVPLTNPGTEPLNVRGLVEILTPDNQIVETKEVSWVLEPGTRSYSVELKALASLKGEDLTRACWWRLRYRFDVQSKAPVPSAPQEGIRSLSEMTPQLFQLRILQPQKVIPGNDFVISVLAEHPVTHKPVPGVQISANLLMHLQTTEKTQGKSEFTDPNGVAQLQLSAPNGMPDQVYQLSIKGQLGPLELEKTQSLDTDVEARITIWTDKLLYQPGQTVHMRVLVRDAAGIPLKNEKIHVAVKDPEDTVVTQAELTTSRFGIAHLDWKTLETTLLGDYHLEVDHSLSFRQKIWGTSVTISRYELPQFRVGVKLDRPFVLPGQSVTATVQADYLFGKPVPGATVKLFRETARTWNYKTQKWDYERFDPQQAKSDEQGQVSFTLNLAEAWRSLPPDSEQRYQDLTFCADCTDPVSGKTETGRFTVRLSRQPIHVYFHQAGTDLRFPFRFFMTTCYADGTPVSCPVEIQIKPAEKSLQKPIHKTVTTNQLGVQKVEIEPLNRLALPDSSWEMTLTARDGKGNQGNIRSTLNQGSETEILIDTDQYLYRAGDPISLRFEVPATCPPQSPVIVQAHSQGKIVYSGTVQMVNRKGMLSLPWNRNFEGFVRIQAGTTVTDPVFHNRTYFQGGQTVIFPVPPLLNVSVDRSQPVYRPGEEAKVQVKVSHTSGGSVESALGISVVDKAVAERLRVSRTTTQPETEGQSATTAIPSYSNISLEELTGLYAAQKFPTELNCVAGLLLTNEPPVGMEENEIGRITEEAWDVFSPEVRKTLVTLTTCLDKVYQQAQVYPTSQASLERILAQGGLDYRNILDPWGNPFQAAFFTEKERQGVAFSTAGPDEQFGTGDDFVATRLVWIYFRPIGNLMDRAIYEYHARTGKFLRSTLALKQALLQQGIDFAAQRDPFGNPFRLECGIHKTSYVVNVFSPGDPQKAEGEQLVWSSRIDYFKDTERLIAQALDLFFAETGRVPATEADFARALKFKGIDWNRIKDPWGNPYEVQFSESYPLLNRPGQEGKGPRSIEVQHLLYLTVMSRGEKAGPQHPADDFEVAKFSHPVTSSRFSLNLRPITSVETLHRFSRFHLTRATISGTVRDATGASIPGAEVTIIHTATQQQKSTTTDAAGEFLVTDLEAGEYSIKIESVGFSPLKMIGIWLPSANLFEASFTLIAGGGNEIVEVTDSNLALNTTTSSASLASTVTSDSVVTKQPSAQAVSFTTPKVRDYFPETAFWEPELVTGTDGRTQFGFKIPDSLTTWSMLVTAITEDGKIGASSTEFRSFQPFFVDHEPPPTLTVGDRISLPVAVRNYTPTDQSVRLQMKPEDWFSQEEPLPGSVLVPANGVTKAVVNLQARQSVRGGKNRVSAISETDQDAVEKPVTVHPDGAEQVATAGTLLSGSGRLELDIPSDSLPGTIQGHLKIYPNLLAHAIEGIEGIIERPHGCGEQTISSTYPNLLVLKYLKKTGQKSAVSGKAERFLVEGYQRLLTYRTASGGFSYWTGGAPNLALSAYALRFLLEAKEFTSIDLHVVQALENWLVSQQSSKGAWGTEKETAYVTAVLARGDTSPHAVKKGLDYLTQSLSTTSDPYQLACLVLAGQSIGQKETVTVAVSKLRSLTRTTLKGKCWSASASTPFYGWGLAGDLETTALVLRALQNQPGAESMIFDGLHFLIKNKDLYGVWHSTQATINVLDTLLDSRLVQTDQEPATKLEFRVNGKPVPLPGGSQQEQFSGPVMLDVSQYLKAGNNVVEVTDGGGKAVTSVQVVSRFYVPWTELPETSPGHPVLKVAFDTTTSEPFQPITCTVEVKQGDGRGMLIAEIGLPPGNQMDQKSVKDLLNEGKAGIRMVDMLPDRLRLYLWPNQAQVKFAFRFWGRYGIKAKNAASQLYDYYNPAASSIVKPVEFTIQ